ncbi:CHAD domain-containing protein [uncultured Comamonas sp.]|uniref:CHAD domain-containing protein n=1 Tax=uncultured Comamonas sp. TaxID=114710 RepID=UPI0025F7F506|nr:CHAD domain-containing protein [uncultured Comamonas sp.]
MSTALQVAAGRSLMTTASGVRMGKGRSGAKAAFSALASPLVDSAVEQAWDLARVPAVEGIHQLRITLRSLMTLWWLYRPLLDAQGYARQRSSLKSIAIAAGKARDYDILIELLGRHDKCGAAAMAALMAAREAAIQAAQDMLSPPRLQTRLEDVLKQASASLDTNARQPRLKAFAKTRLATSRRQLGRRIRRAVAARTPELQAFHAVRKAGKKTRYLLELFGPLLPADHRRLRKRLQKIQQPLGELNDLAVSESLLWQNPHLIASPDQADTARRWLRKKRKHRLDDLARLLRESRKLKRG